MDQESVFEIQYSNGQGYLRLGACNQWTGKLLVQQCGVRGFKRVQWPCLMHQAGAQICQQQIWQLFMPPETRRKDVTVFNVEAYKVANPQFNIVPTR